jgi:hypothetical protein
MEPIQTSIWELTFVKQWSQGQLYNKVYFYTTQVGNQELATDSVLPITGILQLHASTGGWFNLRQKQGKPCAQWTSSLGPQI